MLSLSSVCNTSQSQTTVSQQNQNNLDPSAQKVIKLSRRLEGFLEKHAPPPSTGYLTHPTSSSRVRSSADNFYLDVEEYSQIHGTACAALSLLKSDVRAAVKRCLPIIPGATKQKMQRFCPTSIEESDRQASRVSKRTKDMLFIAEKVRLYNIFEDRCGVILDLWHVAPTDTNPKDAQKIWIKTPDGHKSPFCYAKCLNYARTIRCYRTSDPSKGSFLLDENQASVLALSVAYTLGATLKHRRFRDIDILIEKETLNNGEEIYVTDSVLLQIIILISLVARDMHPYTKDVKPEAIFSEDERNVIILTSNIFREQVLGTITLNKDGDGVSETKPIEFPRISKNSDPWRRPRVDQLSSSTIQEENFDASVREQEEGISPYTAAKLLAISSAILNPSPLKEAPPRTPTAGFSPDFLSPSPYDGENSRTLDVNSAPLTDAPPLTPSPGASPQHLSPHDGENSYTFGMTSSPLPDAPPLTPSPTLRQESIHRWYP
ncbi:hypothetical protein [Chlamydia abortus]|uniref:hypothetical protein n=1 Tax=Chlamydia abortus TaxID=83555 RepID=UPI00052AC9FB|nr:hypothetical protein [Chlamydia abortus]QRR31438.1 hypothetical protein JS522_03520 [Chlamydia abortus]CED80725.1 hypothetical protein AB7_7501 [Chlamydia abortus]CED81685.1 hypothetical protein CA1H_7501 [Chlamydia abortus]CEF17131.1 hypothetical protein CEVAC_7501 [Chlamydia abortus]SFZ99704.1 Uncharacterised protein [Chlamydia abortus]